MKSILFKALAIFVLGNSMAQAQSSCGPRSPDCCLTKHGWQWCGNETQSLVSTAGVDLKLRIVCDNGLEVQTPDFLPNAGEVSSIYGWVREGQGNQFSYQELKISLNDQGRRSLSLFHPFCVLSLTEKNNEEWILSGNCEGVRQSIVSCRSAD